MLKVKEFFVYIITNTRDTVFYTGITNDIERRMWEHKNKIIKGFTSKYNIEKLVYLEKHCSSQEAIGREKYIKKLSRKNKLKLIQKNNPDFKDLVEY
ncbi:MAG: GIY-YIG nuclease family protein [Candidatus Kuenenbacteria bacterium]